MITTLTNQYKYDIAKLYIYAIHFFQLFPFYLFENMALYG
jgi:hypothetical protein